MRSIRLWFPSKVRLLLSRSKWDVGSATSASCEPTVCGLFTLEEAQLLVNTFNRCMASCDFGSEVVIRLLNDKRSLFKSLLERCTDEAHNIEVFDVTKLRKNAPRASMVADGVTRFFAKLVKMMERPDATEEKFCEMCRANGVLHYRMKVWFQAENWLCVKRSVIETIIMTNHKPDTPRRTLSAANFRLGYQRGLRSRSMEQLSDADRQSIEATWTKLVQLVIHNMKQGFLEAAMSSNDEIVL
ncbi:Protein GLB-2 [Aphelenchoides avenae]|nr:Protein GLB-2 [Aphelenchus avenae]